MTLIEWAERLEDAMPDERLDVLIDGSGEEPRTITLQAGESHERYLEAVPPGGPEAATTTEVVR